jgi:hypothetical protein
VQRYPLGTPLTVHAVSGDGTAGRRLGHGVVTDHPGPEHVTVESRYGTRRVAHLNQVSQPHQPAPSTPPPQAEPLAAEDRWASACRAIDPRVVADPHWPALARSLDRIEATGRDVEQLLREVTAQRALPAGSPARSLDYRVADAAPEATGAPGQPWTAAPTPAQPSGPSVPVNAPRLGRGCPAR